jgi:hypothetical protein
LRKVSKTRGRKRMEGEGWKRREDGGRMPNEKEGMFKQVGQDVKDRGQRRRRMVAEEGGWRKKGRGGESMERVEGRERIEEERLTKKE